jgi:putative endonuclease
MVYFVYILENSLTKMLYIGFTKNLKRRLFEHKKGKSNFTRNNKADGDWRLIYFEGYCNQKDAQSREVFLKGGSGRNYIKKQLKNYFLGNRMPG